MTGKEKTAIAVFFIFVATVVVCLLWSNGEDEKSLGDDAAAAAELRSAAIRRAQGDDAGVNESRLVDSQPAEASAAAPAAESAPTTMSSAYGALAVRLVFARTKAPAANHLVKLMAWGQDNPDFRAQWLRTDAAGEIAFEKVPAGGFLVEAFWGGAATRARLEPGETKTIVLEIPPGSRVEGEVVDAAGAPVAHAIIRLSSTQSMSDGIDVGSADAAGKFVLGEVDTKSLRIIGAYRDDRSPSPGIFLSGSDVEVKRVRLVVGGPSGSVVALVTGAEGRPVEGAVLLIDTEEGMRQFTGPNGEHCMRAAPHQRTSDADGRAVAQGVRPGTIRVEVRAIGYSLWQGNVEVAVGREALLEIPLELGVTVAGIVRDSKKTPLEKAEIDILNSTGIMGYSRTLSRSDGSFALTSLPIGTFKLRVEKSKLGSATREFNGVAGETIVWNPELSSGLIIAMRFVDPDGRPHAKVSAEATTGRPPGQEFDVKWGTSDADGRLRLDSCRDAAYEVRVRDPIGGFSTIKIIADVRPGAEEMVVVLSPDLFGTCSVTGVVLAPDGSPVGGAQFNCGNRMSGGSPIAYTDKDTGRIAVSKLPPGDYYLRVRGGIYADADREFKLAPNQVLDLGEIRLATPGSATATVDLSALSRPVEMIVSFRGVEGTRGWSQAQVTNGIARSGPLRAGRYEAKLSGAEIADEDRSFEIVEGQDTALSFAPAPGAAVDWIVVDAPGAAPYENVKVRLTGPGSAAAVREWTEKRYPGYDVSFRKGLPYGSYHVEVESPDGRRASHDIVIGASRVAADPVRLTLQ